MMGQLYITETLQMGKHDRFWSSSFHDRYRFNQNTIMNRVWKSKAVLSYTHIYTLGVFLWGIVYFQKLALGLRQIKKGGKRETVNVVLDRGTG